MYMRVSISNVLSPIVVLEDGRSGWGAKSYLLAASSEEEEKAWIGSIQACIDNCG